MTARPSLILLKDLSQKYENIKQQEAEKCNMKNRGKKRIGL